MASTSSLAGNDHIVEIAKPSNLADLLTGGVIDADLGSYIAFGVEGKGLDVPVQRTPLSQLVGVAQLSRCRKR